MKDNSPAIMSVSISLAFNYVIYAVCLFVLVSGLALLHKQELLWGLVAVILPVITCYSLMGNTKDLHAELKGYVHIVNENQIQRKNTTSCTR